MGPPGKKDLMRRTIHIILLLGFACLLDSARAADPAPGAILTAAGSVALPGVEGRLDHMAVNAQTRRLFIAGLENHSLEVVDLDKKARVRSLPGINETQGLLCLPQFDLLLACSRGDGTCRSFAAGTLKEGSWADLGHNADNVRFDARSGTVYVGAGGEPGAGVLSAIDVKCFLPPGSGGLPAPQRSPADLLHDRPGLFDARAEVELKGHPESFQIAPDGRRIYVNVPDDHAIAVIDVTSAGLKLAARWPVTAGAKNFPMALSGDGARLFIACRQPACLVCYDTRTGQELSRADCAGDADDLFFDASTNRVYLIGGEGYVDVFAPAADASGGLKRLARVPTRPRARTGLFIAKLGLLCVVAPNTPGQPAVVLLFRVSR